MSPPSMETSPVYLPGCQTLLTIPAAQTAGDGGRIRNNEQILRNPPWQSQNLQQAFLDWV